MLWMQQPGWICHHALSLLLSVPLLSLVPHFLLPLKLLFLWYGRHHCAACQTDTADILNATTHI